MSKTKKYNLLQSKRQKMKIIICNECMREKDHALSQVTHKHPQENPSYQQANRQLL